MRVFNGVVLFFLSFAMTGFCSEKPNRLRVVTTLFPLYDFCRQVGGDQVECSILLPPGVEAHGFDPSPQDVLAINEADVFVYTSDDMELWVAGFRKNLSAEVAVVSAGDGLATLSTSGHASCEHGCTHHDHKKVAMDPHVWLDFDKAAKMVDVIAHAFSRVRPEEKSYFKARATTYKTKLNVLDDRTRDELSKCKLKTILSGGHFAFGYYVVRYGLSHQSPYEGFAPDAEPSPVAIAELMDTLREQGQTTVFYEEMLDDRVATVISVETGAKLALLHAAHNLTREEFERGETFISIMDGNLERLTTALREPVILPNQGATSSRTAGMSIFIFIVVLAVFGIGLIVFNKKRA